ncbi:hypothetical protein GGU11DRAFT_780698 [Lentinula aff. detonsa]|nr:hypothetical protein GGU11DRAFT_780698 [Lentinula aff. detonsa]
MVYLNLCGATFKALLMVLGLASVVPLVAVPVSAPASPGSQQSRTVYATVWFKDVGEGQRITSDDIQHLQWATRKLMEKFTAKEYNTANIPFLSWEDGPTNFAPEGFDFTFSTEVPPEGIRYHSGRVQLLLSRKVWKYRGSIWNKVNPAKEDKPAVVKNTWTVPTFSLAAVELQNDRPSKLLKGHCDSIRS